MPALSISASPVLLYMQQDLVLVSDSLPNFELLFAHLGIEHDVLSYFFGSVEHYFGPAKPINRAW